MYPRAYICLSLETSFPNDSQIPPFSPHLRYESRIIVVPSRFIDHPNFSPPFLHRRITNDIIIPLSSFTFFFFFPFFQSSPSLLGYVCTISARVTQRPLNPRRSIKLEREVEAPPSLSLPLSLPSSPWWV